MSRVKSSKKLNRLMLPLLIIVAIAAFALTNYYLTQEKQSLIEAPIYQYFMGNRTEYPAGTYLVLGERNIIFLHDDGQSDGDESPIYYADSDRFIIPENMSWIDWTTGAEWLIPALSEIYIGSDGGVWCDSSDTTTKLSGGFLSDDGGNLFFLDDTDITVDGKKYSVSKFSFYSTQDNQTRIYDYDSEELTMKNTLYSSVSSKSEYGYEINIVSGIYTGIDGSKRLIIANPDVLKSITEK